MKQKQRATVIAATLVVVLLVGSAFTSRKVETLRGKEATLEEVLYLPSGKVLKRMSLGYSSLLADIYWTRAVQYYGGRLMKRTSHSELLAPLLEITTDLDPHLIRAYQTGSLFLSMAKPVGAGEPDKAVALVEKGIRENPTYWRLYFTLGFIHYIDRRDNKAAQVAFQKGSEVPGAYFWMKNMAARMAERTNDLSTAMYLWKQVYDDTREETARNVALQHLASLQAEADIQELQRRIQLCRQKTHVLPSQWRDLVQSGLLPGTPLDPTQTPYKLMPDGTVQVRDPSKFPFLGEGRMRDFVGQGRTNDQ